jgi:hypothetical protein
MIIFIIFINFINLFYNNYLDFMDSGAGHDEECLVHYQKLKMEKIYK